MRYQQNDLKELIHQIKTPTHSTPCFLIIAYLTASSPVTSCVPRVISAEFLPVGKAESVIGACCMQCATEQRLFYLRFGKSTRLPLYTLSAET